MESIEAKVREFGAQANQLIWDEIPWGGATTLSPKSLDLPQFLSFAQSVGAGVLYLDPRGVAVAFAAQGVIHIFATTEERARLVGDGPSADLEDDFIDEISGLEFTLQSDGHKDPYFDWESGTTVWGVVRSAVDAIVADDRFNGHSSGHVVADHVEGLSTVEAKIADRVSKRVFFENVGKQLDNRAKQLAYALAKDPKYDPLLPWGSDLRTFIETRVDETDPRLLERVQRALTSHAFHSGAREEAERELARIAESVLTALTPAERDRLGFSSKGAMRMQLLAPHIVGESSAKAERIAKEVSRLEKEQYQLSREERYATAVRLLRTRGMSHAEVSRRLRISHSIVERIVATHDRNVDFEPGDPLMAALQIGL